MKPSLQTRFVTADGKLTPEALRLLSAMGAAVSGVSVAWADVTGKPTTFTPTSHTHPQSEVTGLVSDLAGKAASSHTHAQSDVTNLVSDLAGKQPLATVLTNTTAAFTTAQETKLSGIAAGATANSSDATLLARANHTGTQAWSTITGTPTTRAGYGITDAAASTHTHAASEISDSTTAGRAMLTAATVAAQTALLDTVTSGAKGLAPASGGGTANFLRADGTWAAPSGGATYNYGQLTADYTLTSTTSAQKLFNFSTNGALTLATGRYLFRCMILVQSMSATSGNAKFLLKGAGTATVGNIFYHTSGLDNNTGITTGARGGSASVTESGPAAMVTAGTGTQLMAETRGIFNVTVTGTIIPSLALLTAAAAVVKAGSYFECIRIGDTGSNTAGTWS